MTTMAEPWIQQCDEYLGARTGNYNYRRVRYSNAWLMLENLDDSHTVVDVGAGWTELDFFLRAEANWRGRYIPVDGGIDGTDLEYWVPPRRADWFVALEIIEHLEDPFRLLRAMQGSADRGVVLSTPNPRTTDVLGMDHTHKTPVSAEELRSADFQVVEHSFYGQPNDSLLGWWYP